MWTVKNYRLSSKGNLTETLKIWRTSFPFYSQISAAAG